MNMIHRQYSCVQDEASLVFTHSQPLAGPAFDCEFGERRTVATLTSTGTQKKKVARMAGSVQ